SYLLRCDFPFTRLLSLFTHVPPHRRCRLSLHDALPILGTPVGGIEHAARGEDVAERPEHLVREPAVVVVDLALAQPDGMDRIRRSEEHTSELQSPDHLVCRLLLEKKKSRMRERARTTAS